MPISLGAQLDEKGWEAGAVISQDMVPVLAPYITRVGQPPTDISASDWLVVISQTCDVVHALLEKEPLIEVLHCRPVEKLRADFQGRRSSRQLDFKPDKDSHEAIALTAHATADRYVIPRELFSEHEPDPNRCLSPRAVRNLQLWYGLRYTRPAWPDALVKRLNKRKTKLAEALKPLPHDEVEVRVAITENDVELVDDHAYHLAVYFVVDQAHWDSSLDARKVVFEAFGAFVSHLAKCKGIDINQDLSGVHSGDDFSWQMTTTTDEWNFANLSQQD